MEADPATKRGRLRSSGKRAKRAPDDSTEVVAAGCVHRGIVATREALWSERQTSCRSGCVTPERRLSQIVSALTFFEVQLRPHMQSSRNRQLQREREGIGPHRKRPRGSSRGLAHPAPDGMLVVYATLGGAQASLPVMPVLDATPPFAVSGLRPSPGSTSSRRHSRTSPFPPGIGRSQAVDPEDVPN